MTAQPYQFPTAEEFLAMPGTPEDDEPEAVDAYDVIGIGDMRGLSEPLVRIAVSLETLVSRAEQNAAMNVPAESYNDLSQAYDDLLDQFGSLGVLVEEVEAIVKPSTSKLANSVREAINGWKTGAVVELAPEIVAASALDVSGDLDQPPHDAPVEAWRTYAEGLVHTADGMNRSQIRTMLGIEQPA